MVKISRNQFHAKRTQRVVVAAMLLLVACGSPDSDPAASTSTAALDESPSESEPVGDTIPDTVQGDTIPDTVQEVPVDDGEQAESPKPTEVEPADAAETRTVETIWGPVEVPANPQAIVSIDEYAALNLLALGVEPQMVIGTYQSLPPKRVIESYGIEMLPGAYGEYNFEAVAAQRPDLIVLVGNEETQDLFDSLTEIAPTVVIPYIAPWRDIVAFTGTLLGREDQATNLVAAVETEIEALQATVEPGMSVGILANAQGFGVYSIGQETSVSDALAEAGIERPEPEQESASLGVALPTSEELIGDHAADLMVVLGGNDFAFPAELVLDLEVFQAIPAVQAGNYIEVLGDVWTGTGPFAVNWVIQDMAAVQAGDGQDGVGDLDDVAERWAEFVTFAEGAA